MNPRLSKVLRLCLPVILLPLVLEVAVYNFPHWESLFFSPVSGYETVIGAGLRIDGKTARITDPDAAYIELSGINSKVENIFLDAEAEDGDTLPVSVCVKDDTNSSYLALPEKELVRGFDGTKFLRVHTNGASPSVMIRVNESEDTCFTYRGIGVNAVRPFVFRKLRVVCLCLFILFILLFRAGSFLYSVPLDFGRKRQMAVLAGVLICCAFFSWFVTDCTDVRRNWSGFSRTYRQYEELTEALAQGELSLAEEPGPALKALSNPYDPSLRDQALSEAGEICLYDTAYYNGKYYVWYGVTPVLLFFLPVRLLTGAVPATWQVMAVCAWLFCCGVFYFLYMLCRRYRYAISLGHYLLFSFLLIVTMGMIWQASYPTNYTMPAMTGMMLTVWGLGFWLRAGLAKERIPRGYLLAGAFCIAMVAGCRPHMALVVLLAFPLFSDAIREGSFFRLQKGSMANTLCVILPFVAYGAFLMVYNMLRFGSPLDFGATYNLTVIDVAHRQWHLARNGIGIFEHLLQPMHVIPQFPFIIGVDLHNVYQGDFYTDPLHGGFYAINPILLCGFLTIAYREALKKKKVLGLIAVCFILAVILLEIDIQMMGLSSRYQSDYGLLLSLPALFVMLTLLEERGEEKKGIDLLQGGIVYGSLFSIAVNCLMLFAYNRELSMFWTNPSVFYWVKTNLFFG